MRRSSSLLLVWLTLIPGSPALCGEANKNAAPRRYSVEQFLAGSDAFGASFSADETRVLFSWNRSRIFNAYSVSVTGKPATPTALTHSASDSTYAVAYFPRDDRFLYSRDQAGNEASHLYVRQPSGEERDLTPGEKLKARFVRFSKDGRWLYLVTNERDSRHFDLYRYDVDSYQRKLVYKNEKAMEVSSVSPDGKWLALIKPNGPSDSDLYVQALDDGQLRHLSPHEQSAEYASATFDAQSRWLYFLTNEGTEFKRVRRYALDNGLLEDVERADWDVEATTFSHEGKYRVTTINQDGRSVLRVRDGRSGAEIRLPAFPEGQIQGLVISRSERFFAFYLATSRAPGSLHLLDMHTGRLTRIVDTLSPELNPADLVEAQSVRFESFDGTPIPAFLYQPREATPSKPAPALILVHGGPGGQWGPGWNTLFQLLVNQGYVVLAVNNRGSSGYGKSFYTADDGKHGRDPLWDCIAAKHYLQTQRYVHAKQIGIMGSSYGGYMVLAGLALSPQVFAVGVDMFGISNWLRTLRAIPAWYEPIRQSLYKEVGDPAKDEPKLRAVSPLFHAHRIVRPLLVIQGANDQRVLRAESDEIVAAVKRNGVPVDYLVFDDEGHGLSKQRNQVQAWTKILQFLERHLRGPGEMTVPPNDP